MAKPTYLGIGAQKCASSWLHQVLASHPQVGVPAVKEVDFFSYRFDHGYQWYERQFIDCVGKTALGEISPSYFSEPAVPARVSRYLPDARILVSFRAPVERALSNHRHEVRVGHFSGDDLSFEAGMANNPMYIEQSCYASHLKRWLKHFPREQIHVVLVDDIKSNPLAVASAAYAFLGVDSSYRSPSITTKFNESYATRSARLRSMKDTIYALTRTKGLGWMWRVGSAVGVKAWYRRANVVSSGVVIPPPSAELLDELRRRFAPEIGELSELIQRPLDSWL